MKGSILSYSNANMQHTIQLQVYTYQNDVLDIGPDLNYLLLDLAAHNGHSEV